LNGERADRNFQISLWNNLRWLVLYLLAVPLGLFIALFLNQNVRGIRLYKSLFFFPLSSVRLSSVWCFRGSICPITGCSRS
jgi:ABC-type sugar transport systems, permease components